MTDFVIRAGREDDAEALYGLIRSHQEEGHLLPRGLDEIRRRASRFVVAESGGVIQACAELAPLSSAVAEVRSLVVSSTFRRVGVARRLVDEVRQRAKADGFQTLCAFTHDARFFVRQNFSMVPHMWLNEKIQKDCLACPLFQKCGQYAMVLPLAEVARYDANNAPDRRVAVA